MYHVRACPDLCVPPTRALGMYSPATDTIGGVETKNGKVEHYYPPELWQTLRRVHSLAEPWIS